MAPLLGGKALPAAPPELLASDISFDNETGEIKYTLPEAALIRIRIGIKDGGALLRNLVDWEPRGAGPHTEVWDHKDAKGIVDFKSNLDLLLTLSCLPADPVKRGAYKGIIKGFRPAPKLRIVFPRSVPGPAALSPDGQASPLVLTGVVPVRVLIDPEDNRWLVETKYELGLFIDNIFLAEDEEGVNPYTYTFNTKGLNDGPHIITANIVGYEGEVGTESVVVMVENGR
jgi:hypothetical protein